MNLKDFASSLANRINQAHYVEHQLKKVFNAGVKYATEKRWIDVNEKRPELINNKYYSPNVLAICNGQLMVMCYCYNPSEDESERGFFWSNCNGQIDGDAEFDDEYDVTFWQYLPSIDGVS